MPRKKLNETASNRSLYSFPERSKGERNDISYNKGMGPEDKGEDDSQKKKGKRRRDKGTGKRKGDRLPPMPVQPLDYDEQAEIQPEGVMQLTTRRRQ